eukprot:Hpha_TRINITY_DN8885_c0_g1::TRINITY_DN8885_c0_g1_i2::g.141611::m.141611
MGCGSSAATESARASSSKRAGGGETREQPPAVPPFCSTAAGPGLAERTEENHCPRAKLREDPDAGHADGGVDGGAATVPEKGFAAAEEHEELREALDALHSIPPDALKERQRCQDTLNELCMQPRALAMLRGMVAEFEGCLQWVDERLHLARSTGVKVVVSDAQAQDFLPLLEPAERKVKFVDEAVPLPGLLEWLEALPGVTPSLGYEAVHFAKIARTVKTVLERERASLLKVVEGGGDAADWMVTLALQGAKLGCQMFLAGVLYTADLTEEVDTGGKQKEKTIWLKDAEVLKAHGVFDGKEQRLPLYFTMNAAMRNVVRCMRHDEVDVFKCAHTPPQLHVLRTFAPLIRLCDALVRVLPSEETIVFRGVRENLSSRYRVGSVVVWNAFSSTSLVKEVALEFMSDDGTFFVVIAKHAAARIHFCSEWPEEEELLYRSNVEFRVMWKFSPTLLRMLGLSFDVIVMQETVGGTAVADISTCMAVLEHTADFFDGYMAQYVEGRVGHWEAVPENESECLRDWLRSWLDSSPSGARRPVCIVGGGGSGKTSAAIALVSWLLVPTRAARAAAAAAAVVVAAAHTFPVDVTGGLKAEAAAAEEAAVGRKKVFPMFIPLPAVRELLLKRDGLSEYIETAFALDRDRREALARQYDVVLVLDSLDETGLSGEDFSSAGVGPGLGSFLNLHPWAQEHCSVVVTTRGEYLKATGLSAACLFGNKVQVQFLQPLSHSDAVRYMAQRMSSTMADEARGNMKGDGFAKRFAAVSDLSLGAEATMEAKAEWLFGQFTWATGNPFLLSMLMHDPLRVIDELSIELRKKSLVVQEVDLKELYLRKHADAADVDEVLRAGEAIACLMVRRNVWQVRLDEVMAVVENVREREHNSDRVRRVLKRLPLRVEDWGNLESSVSFQHRILGEYLCARLLWRAEGTLLTEFSSLSFSKENPNVTRFFAQLKAADADGFSTRLLPAYQRMVRESLCGTDAAVNAASNALALLAGCRSLLENVQWREVVCRGADIRDLRVWGSDLRGACFKDCWMEGCEFFNCDLTDVDTTGSLLSLQLGKAEFAGIVYGIAISPDGSKIAGGGEDCTVSIWDADNALEVTGTVKKLEGHKKSVTSVAFSADGARVVSGSEDGTVRVWSAEEGGELFALEGHSGAVRSVSFASGSKVVSGGDDKTILIWDAAAGSEPQRMEGHTGGVRAVIFCPATSRLASCSEDSSVRVWDPASGQELQCLEGHTDVVNGVAFSSNGSRIASGGIDRCVRVWDTLSGNEVLVVQHASHVCAVAFSPDGARVASCSRDETVRMWDVVCGIELGTFVGHCAHVFCVAFSPDGSRIVSGGRDRCVRIWDAASGLNSLEVGGHFGAVRGLSVSADGSRILTGGDDMTLRVWGASTGVELLRFRSTLDTKLRKTSTGLVYNSFIWSPSYSPDCTRIIASDMSSYFVLDAATLQLLWRCGQVTCSASWSPDGSRILSGSFNGEVQIRDAVSFELTRTLTLGNTAPITKITFTPCGSRFVAASGSSIGVWDMDSGEQTLSLEGESAWCVAISPDGNRVAGLTCSATELRVWDAESGQVIKAMPFPHGPSVRGPPAYVTFSPDSKVAATTGKDGTIRLWDTESWQQIGKVEGHTNANNTVLFFPDGSRVVSASADGTTRVADVTSLLSAGEASDTPGSYRPVLVLGRAGGSVRCYNCTGTLVPPGESGWAGDRPDAIEDCPADSS